jgi:hypothetical protein
VSKRLSMMSQRLASSVCHVFFFVRFLAIIINIRYWRKSLVIILGSMITVCGNGSNFQPVVWRKSGISWSLS